MIKYQNSIYSLSFNPETLTMSYRELEDNNRSMSDRVKLNNVVELMEFVVELLGDWQYYNNYIPDSKDRDFFSACTTAYIK